MENPLEDEEEVKVLKKTILDIRCTSSQFTRSLTTVGCFVLTYTHDGLKSYRRDVSKRNRVQPNGSRLTENERKHLDKERKYYVYDYEVIKFG
ncbi:hypothetical protein OUZ56_016025 [Daphnia magna]|uniref:Uncharacterized protein n=1 Tax=Daphnia magna TaxID=35525 RepID=A0ABR0APM4_9CRUS|nr:hypothetical protein OUZ56_016025 [Daphnia magna]